MGVQNRLQLARLPRELVFVTLDTHARRFLTPLRYFFGGMAPLSAASPGSMYSVAGAP